MRSELSAELEWDNKRARVFLGQTHSLTQTTSVAPVSPLSMSMPTKTTSQEVEELRRRISEKKERSRRKQEQQELRVREEEERRERERRTEEKRLEEEKAKLLTELVAEESDMESIEDIVSVAFSLAVVLTDSSLQGLPITMTSGNATKEVPERAVEKTLEKAEEIQAVEIVKAQGSSESSVKCVRCTEKGLACAKTRGRRQRSCD